MTLLVSNCQSSVMCFSNMNSEITSSILLRHLTFESVLLLLDEHGILLCFKLSLRTLLFASKAFMHFFVRSKPIASRFTWTGFSRTSANLSLQIYLYAATWPRFWDEKCRFIPEFWIMYFLIGIPLRGFSKRITMC